MFKPVEVLRLVEVRAVYVHLKREPKPRLFEVWFRTEDNDETYYHYYAKDELHAYQRGLECISEYRKINQTKPKNLTNVRNKGEPNG